MKEITQAQIESWNNGKLETMCGKVENEIIGARSQKDYDDEYNYVGTDDPGLVKVRDMILNEMGNRGLDEV